MLQTKQTIFDNQTIFYQTNNLNTAPLIFIHGFAEDATIWNETWPFFAEYNTVIIHLPGCGLNRHLTPNLCNINTAAAIINHLANEQNWANITLVGHSMGGYIALQLAKAQSQLVAKISMVHSSIFADTDEKIKARLKNIEFIEKHSAALFLKQTVPNLFAEQFVNNQVDWLKKYIENISYLTQETLVAYLKSMMNRESSEQWITETNIPMQFICGKLDLAIPYLNSLAQSHLPKISYFHSLQTVAHSGTFEATNQVNEYILKFVKL